jgi:hypothetical protein
LCKAKMMPNSKVHPSEEIISAKCLDLGPCIVITPKTLDLGHQIQDKQFDDPEVMTLYSDKEEAHENIKILSPVHSEDKVNVNYSYTFHSQGEAPRDNKKYAVATKNAKDAEQFPQPIQQKLLSFNSSVKPVVLPSPEDNNWRRKSVVSKDLSTGRKNKDDPNKGL